MFAEIRSNLLRCVLVFVFPSFVDGIQLAKSILRLLKPGPLKDSNLGPACYLHLKFLTASELWFTSPRNYFNFKLSTPEICSIRNASCVHFAVIYDQCYHKRFWDDCCSFFQRTPLDDFQKIACHLPASPKECCFHDIPTAAIVGKESKKRSDRHGSSPTPPDSGSGCVARAWTGEGKPRMNEAQCLRRLAIFDPGLPLSKADLLGCVLFPELQELHKRSFNLDWWYQEMMQHTIDHQPFLATLWNWELSSGARD